MVLVSDLYGQYDVPLETMSFRPAVYGVLIRDDMVLLMPLKDKFWFPGGGIEIGENHLDALQREVMEETGMTIRPIKLLNVYSSMYTSYKHIKNHHCIQIYYVCEVLKESNTATFTDDERQYLKPAVWVKISELQNYPYAGVESIFDDIQAYYNNLKAGKNQ